MALYKSLLLFKDDCTGEMSLQIKISFLSDLKQMSFTLPAHFIVHLAVL